MLIWSLLPLVVFSENYLLEVGEEQTLLVPSVSFGYVDHTVWSCDKTNVSFVEKTNSGAKVKITSYSAEPATISLIYVVKYSDNKGFTRSYTGTNYYTIQCKGSAPMIVPSGITLKVGETYQLHISPSSYESQAVWSEWEPISARVSSDGVVTARKETSFNAIFATIPGLSSPLTCQVVVVNPKLTLNANLASGTIEKGKEVTLNASKSNATIYYTLDGTSPDMNGEKYDAPIAINSSLTLKAIAYDNDEEKEPSDILERIYTVENGEEDGSEPVGSTSDNVIYVDDVTAFAGDELTLSIRMKNNVPVRGFQFNLYLPGGVTAVTNAKGKLQASLNSERLDEDDEHTLSATEQNDGSILFLCGSQYDETFADGDGEIATVLLTVDESIKSGNYSILLKNIKLTESDINKYYETSSLSSKLKILNYVLGDINGDEQVDVSDYIGIANRIHGEAQDGFIEKMADVDENGVIDISDYIGVANIIHTGSIYGDALHATIVTNEATNVGEKSATLNATLNVVSATKPYTVGFFVATSGTPSFENNIKNVVSGSNKKGSFSSAVTGLEYTTTYYFCSYILYEGVYYYGEMQSFTTTKKTTFEIGDLYPDDKNPIGVVFYLSSSNGKSGKIVSLESVSRNWYGAYNWASNYGSGWSLPTKGELQRIANNYSKLSNYINNGFYWSSTIYSSGALDTLAWVVTIGYYMGYTNGETFYNSADINTRGVLAVKAF